MEKYPARRLLLKYKKQIRPWFGFLILIILIVIFPLILSATEKQQQYRQQAASTVSPLIFGTNLTLNDASDQFLTSAQTRSALQQIHVQIIRMPIRSIGGPSTWEVQAMQDIKAMGVIPMINLKFSQTDPTGAAKLVIQQANAIFGNNPVYYEFGNERDLAGVNQTAYTAQWNKTISQVKPLAANGKFGGPVNYQYNPSYVSYFVHNANPKPDFIAWHEYTCGNSDSAQSCINNIHNWASHINSTKSAIQANGDSVPPIFITEWNYDPNNPSPDPRATPQFEQTFTQTALQELANDGVTGANHYVATGHTEYNLVDPSGNLTPEGQMFGQMYTTLIGAGGPTATTQPTIPQTTTPMPGGHTIFSVTICPHGLGNCGDNVNPNSGGNTNPLHPQRNLIITVLNGSNQVVATQQGIVNYNSSGGNFTGNIDMGNLPGGSYLVTLRTDFFLSKQIPGIQIITGGQTNTIPAVSLVAGDVNNDNQLDTQDYYALVNCFGSKANTSSCVNKIAADINDDGSVDGVDYNLFLRELSIQYGSGGYLSALPGQVNFMHSAPAALTPIFTGLDNMVFGQLRCLLLPTT